MKRNYLAFGILIALYLFGKQAAAAHVPQPHTPPSSSTPATSPLAHLKRHPTVALTFDDLPAAGGLLPGQTRTRVVSQLAKELRAGHLKGTYGFLTAVDLENDPDTQAALHRWISSGMNIGNHTWSHPSLTQVDAKIFERDIAADEPAAHQYAGKRDWHWFRYPYLEEGDTLQKRESVRAWLHAHGYKIAEVTLTTQDDDWSDPYDRCLAKHDAAGIAWLERSYLVNAAQFIQLGREEEKIAFGREIPNVLVLHATAFTTLMLPSLLHLLHQEGFRFASLSRVERNRAYALDPHAGLAEGGPFPNLFLNSRHLLYPPFQPEPLQQLNSVCR